MASEPLIYIDGKYYPKGEAKISVYDHGLLYGDGVFEGIRCYNGNVFKLKEHIGRLYKSSAYIALKIPVPPEQMEEIVVDCLRKNDLKDAYVRLVVTRGVGDLGLDPRKCPKPTIISIAQYFGPLYGDLYEKGIKIVTVKTRRIDPRALDTRAKTLNYLNNILAKMESTAVGCDESLMLDSRGKVCEGTGDNIFIVKDGKLATPREGTGPLVGITRQTVFELAEKLGVEYEERDIELKEAAGADECFMTGTAAEIIPIVELDGKKIASGTPGYITKKLMSEFEKVREKDGVKI